MKPVRSQVWTLLLFLFLSIFVAGCENEDMQTWKNETKQLRLAAETQIASAPYRREQHLAFKSYFSSLATMALSLQQDAGKRQRFNEAASRAGMNGLCGDVFMGAASWRALMGSCTKNRFFLCAEEVRAYPGFMRAFRGALRPELRQQFDQAPRCTLPTLPAGPL